MLYTVELTLWSTLHAVSRLKLRPQSWPSNAPFAETRLPAPVARGSVRTGALHYAESSGYYPLLFLSGAPHKFITKLDWSFDRSLLESRI